MKLHQLLLPVLLLVVNASSQSWAQQSDDLKIRSLFDAKSRQPGVQIPFQMQGGLANDSVMTSAVVTGTGSETCKVTRDPFRGDIFFLNCAAEAEAVISFQLQVSKSNRVVSSSLGPISVKIPAPDLKVIDPIDPAIVDYKNGLSLFSAKCVSCHNPPGVKKGANEARIKAAIKAGTGVGMMNGSMMDRSKNQTGVDLTRLTDEEIRLLVVYLKNP